jgi:hypothetical protein
MSKLLQYRESYLNLIRDALRLVIRCNNRNLLVFNEDIPIAILLILILQYQQLYASSSLSRCKDYDEQ